MSARLALVIPTYGRSGIVAENLASMVHEADRLGIALYYSDDSKDGTVEAAVVAHAAGSANVHYVRNTPSLGHDRNILASLALPDADYVWLLADVWRPKPGEMARVLASLEDQDLLFLNRKPSSSAVVSTFTGDAARELVVEKLWNQTLTGATIYHRRVRDWVRDAQPAIRRNFPQLSIIAGYSACHPVSIGWFEDNVLESLPKAESYWSSKALDVFVDDWAAVVKSYPGLIAGDRVRSVLKSHSANTDIFNRNFLLHLRKTGHLNWSSLRKPHFWDAMHLGTGHILAVLLLPRLAARSILKLKWITRRRTAPRR